MQSDIQVLKGIGAMTVCDYETGEPLYQLRSCKNIKVVPKIERDVLKNPQGPGILDEDIRETTYDLSFTANEYPVAVIEHMSGGQKTSYVASASGEVIGIDNVQGDSVYDPVTGCIPQVDASGVVEQKYGAFVLKAKTASTLSIYGTNQLSLHDGTDEDFDDDKLLIADDVAVTSGVETKVQNFGFSIMGGSGTIAMTVGDTAEFRLRRANKAGAKVVIGGINTEYRTVSAYCYPKVKNGKYRGVKLFKFIIAGIPLELGDSYSEYDVSASLQYVSSKDGVMEYFDE